VNVRKQLLMIGVAVLWTTVARVDAQAEIDWTTGTATAVGIGAPPAKAANVAQARSMAIVAARAGAQKGLVELIQGVRINADVIVQDAMASETIRMKVVGFLRGASISKPSYLSDGSVEITATVPIWGPLADAVVPQAGFNASAPMGLPPLQRPGGPPAPAMAVPPSGPTTGFIIDATGLKAVPAMVPRILDENGDAVYSSAQVNRDYAVQYGVVGYSKTVAAARQNDRVGTNPELLAALQAKGKGSSDLIVANATALRLREATARELLQKCRVVFVID
jgi:hypothetical protein